MRTSWYDYKKRALLRELGEDSRVSINYLARKLSSSRSRITQNIDELESRFGLVYTLEFDPSKINMVRDQIIIVKFKRGQRLDGLDEIFKENPFITFAARTEGDFGLVVKLLSDNSKEYIYMLQRLLIALHRYRPIINDCFVVNVELGFSIFQNELIKRLDLSRLGLDPADKRVIMAMNKNSRMDAGELAKKLRMSVRDVKYRLRKISKTGIIRRHTAILTRPPTDYNVIFLADGQIASERMRDQADEARRYYISLDKSLPLINNFQYVAKLIFDYSLFGIGCFENERKVRDWGIGAQREIYGLDASAMHHARILSCVFGYIPIRNIDISG